MLDFEEIQNEFEKGNETIEDIEKQVKENEIITYEIIKPEKIEDKEVIIDSELII